VYLLRVGGEAQKGDGLGRNLKRENPKIDLRTDELHVAHLTLVQRAVLGL
jgi:hypothetical protein